MSHQNLGCDKYNNGTFRDLITDLDNIPGMMQKLREGRYNTQKREGEICFVKPGLLVSWGEETSEPLGLVE